MAGKKFHVWAIWLGDNFRLFGWMEYYCKYGNKKNKSFHKFHGYYLSIYSGLG